MADLARKRNRRRLIELACICFAVAQLGWFIFPHLNTLVRAELNVMDRMATFGKGPPLDDRFVFVAIDDASMKLDQLWPEDIEASPELAAMTGGWPWPRNTYAGAIHRILDAGARFVILDLILTGQRPGDEALKSVLDQFPGKIAIGSNFSLDSVNPAYRDLASPTFLYPSDSLIEDPVEDPRVGYVNFWSDDADFAIRTAVYRFHFQNHNYDSLAARALAGLGLEGKIPPKNRKMAFRFSDTASLPIVPFYTLFLKKDWSTTLRNGEIFENKIVMIGPSAAILHDIQSIAGQRSIPGPIVHINAIAAALDGNFYARSGHVARILSVVIAALLAWTVAAYFSRRPLMTFLSMLVLSASYLVIAASIAHVGDYMAPVIQPESVFVLAGICCTAWNFAQERRESGRMRSTLERYVSRNVVREILDNQEDYLSALGGTRRPMTVFFSDVRGFTSFSERADAGAVVEQLNEYLGEMVGVIFRHNGTVDKFMGDGIMAVWGNVVSAGASVDTINAVNAAIEMQQRIARLNERWEAAGLQKFTVGMGIHHGEAVFGNIGSHEKMEPTVIGDTVNLASRVEGLTKKYGVDICLTQPAAELISDQFLLRSVDLVQVVGKSRPVEIFTLAGLKDVEPPEWITRYESAVADFRARRFEEAALALRKCTAASPTDRLSAIYLDRAERFLAEPPPPEWNGTEIATSK